MDRAMIAARVRLAARARLVESFGWHAPVIGSLAAIERPDKIAGREWTRREPVERKPRQDRPPVIPGEPQAERRLRLRRASRAHYAVKCRAIRQRGMDQ